MTAFDKVAESYWRQYLSGSPIGGGMAYESRVRECVLDESLDSLKNLDKLLILIKKDLDNKRVAGTTQAELLKQSSFRNFLLFLGFYAGRVLAKQIGELSWLDYDTLSNRHTLTGNKNFFLAMAGVPVDNEFAPPFFVLNSLGAKLFGGFSQKFFNPITGQLMSESLYWSVQGYLDELTQNTKTGELIAQHTDAPQTNNQASSMIEQATEEMIVKQATPELVAIHTPNSKSDFVEKSTFEPVPVLESAVQTPPHTVLSEPQQEATIAPKPSTPQTLPPQGLSRRAKEKLERQKNAFKAHFKEVKEDMISMPAVNSTYDDKYQKVKTVLDKVFLLTDGDEEKLAQLNDKQQAILSQAIDALKKLSGAGNTNAMLSLAVCYFQGIGTPKNETDAVPLVQKAAEMGDIRAAKFLSRIYYHGLGVNPSTRLGEIWLDKAAAGGHAEAKKLKNQFIQIKAMRDEYRDEAEKDKRFMLMLAISALVFIAVIAVSAKFL